MGADLAIAEARRLALHHMARWLSLDGINVATKGDLAEPLRHALGR